MNLVAEGNFKISKIKVLIPLILIGIAFLGFLFFSIFYMSSLYIMSIILLSLSMALLTIFVFILGIYLSKDRLVKQRLLLVYEDHIVYEDSSDQTSFNLSFNQIKGIELDKKNLCLVTNSNTYKVSNLSNLTEIKNELDKRVSSQVKKNMKEELDKLLSSKQIDEEEYNLALSKIDLI